MSMEATMPLFLPDGLPAAQILRKEGFDVRSASGDAAPGVLQVALVNLMPGKQDTELAFARLLAQTGRPVALTLLVPGSYRPQTASPDHLVRFYRRWPEMSGRSFDGLIVTGAPVETLPFEEVTYWPEFREMVHWARDHVRQSLYICWSAQAALFVLRQVPKMPLAEKAFGVFEQQLTTSSTATKGMGTSFPVPVSRHAESNRVALAACGAKVIAGSSETGASLVEDPDNRAHFFFDHLEYASDSLLREYERDRSKGLVIAPPRKPTRDQGWEPYASLFYRNWLDIIRPVGEPATASSVEWLFSWSGSFRSTRSTVPARARS
jgi:homoserine O-succinyltransferase